MAPRTFVGRVVVCILLLVGLCLTACRSASPRSADAEVTISEDIILRPLDKNLWVHTTYFEFPGSRRYPANGLIVRDGSHAMLIDLPWTDVQTAELCDWIADNWEATVTTVVPTHFHEDCMGGLAEAHRRGAASYALDRTVALAREKNLPVAQHTFSDEVALHCRKTPVVVKYLGAGHTTDNVVAWLPRRKVLFAGCLVKSANARSLGNTTDGDLDAYPATLHRVRETYPNAKIVVPGHGAWGGPELIDHTLNLCGNRQQ